MNTEGVIRPWEANPYQLLCWWDMEKFTEFFFFIGKTLQDLLIEFDKPVISSGKYIDPPLTEEEKRRLLELLELVKGHSEIVGLRLSVKGAETFIGLINQESYTRQMTATLVGELDRRIMDEMKLTLFMHIPAERARCYSEPIMGWEEVVGRFGQVRLDIEESGRCFACGRFAASVFHILLVAEFGVIQVARLFGVEGERPGWACLRRLDRIRQKNLADRTPLEQKHFKFLDDTIPLMLAVKDSWRHKISHIDNRLVWTDVDFSPLLAEEIRTTTRGLMQRLARDLPAIP